MLIATLNIYLEERFNEPYFIENIQGNKYREFEKKQYCALTTHNKYCIS